MEQSLASRFHTPPPIHQKILLVLPSKYSQNPTTSHHSHCCHYSGPSHRHLCPDCRLVTITLHLTGMDEAEVYCTIKKGTLRRTCNPHLDLPSTAELNGFRKNNLILFAAARAQNPDFFVVLSKSVSHTEL